MLKFLLNITNHKTRLHLRSALICLLFFMPAAKLHAQITVSGTVFDSSKINYVENVRVVSTGGLFAITDSMGKYAIHVSEDDSLIFYYNNKPTQKFAVRSVPDPAHFDISLRVTVKSKYGLLKEVMVFSKSYKEDSIENRQTYAEVYNYKKPGVQTSISPGGGAGADVNELINIFRFKRNKRLKAFQHRLEIQEQEKYIDYRFNKLTVRRITGLQGEYLDTFMVWYRPDYEFVRYSDELVFNQYILNAFYQFQKLVQVPPRKKEDE